MTQQNSGLLVFSEPGLSGVGRPGVDGEAAQTKTPALTSFAIDRYLHLKIAIGLESLLGRLLLAPATNCRRRA